MRKGKKAKYLYEKDGSPYWWYRFTLDGEEYRGSTGTTESKAASDFVEAKRVEIRKDIEARKNGLGQIRGGRKQVTLGQCLEIFEADRGAEWKSLRDKRRYREYLLNLGAGPDMLISELKLLDLRKYRNQRTMMPNGRGGNPQKS